MEEKQGGSAISLFLTFLKIGAFTFGGGYAMLPLIQREVAENRKWVSEKEILDVVAISESTPGPIAINAATFTGYKIAGFAGAFAATVGVVLPSFLIILAITSVLEKFQSIQIVQYAFYGIRAGVLALIVKAFLAMYRQCPKNVFSYIIALLAFWCVAFLHVNALAVIAGCAVFGVVMSLIAERRRRE